MRKGSKMTEEQRQRVREAVRKAMSPEVRIKMSLAKRGKPSSWKGKHPSQESLKKMRESHLGQVSWNKGKKGIYSEETLKKMSEAKKGYIPWIKGKHHTPETIAKFSASLKGRTPWNKGKTLPYKPRYKMRGRVSWNKGKSLEALKGRKISEEIRRKLSESHKGKGYLLKGRHVSPKTEFKKGHGFNAETIKKMSLAKIGEKSPLWRGGISFEPYSPEWTKALKKSIRERDDYTCQLCGKLQTNRTFAVHHIDYDKKNSKPENLITLCQNCHTKTTRNREFWKAFFKR